MKNYLIILLVALLMVSCTPAAETTGQDFIDDAGRTVRLPATITKVSPSGNPAQIILYTIAPEKLLNWAQKPGGAIAEYMDETYVNLPEFGAFYSKNSNLNLEELIKAAPDLIIDIGEKKSDVAEQMDNIQTQTGIPTIFIEAELESMPQAFRKLGELLDEPERAEAQAKYMEETIQLANDYRNKITQPVRVYYGLGMDGMEANAKGSVHADILEFVGLENVAVIENTQGSATNVVSPEQILQWAPEALLFDSGSVYPNLSSDPFFSELVLPAYESPSGPYNWIGRPPSVNRYLGIKWLGQVFYPEVYNLDLVKEAQEFYQLFYHYDLSEEKAIELLGDSLKSK